MSLNPFVLIAEDDPADLLLLKRAIAKAGIHFHYHVAPHGDAVMDYLLARAPYQDQEQFPAPDLLLLDLKMPRLSGFEILGLVRSHEKLHRLPIVVFTSSSSPDDVNRAYDLGANSYLTKPLDSSDLVSLVQMIDSYWLRLNVRPEISF